MKMPSLIFSYVLCLAFFSLMPAGVSAQPNSSVDWMRVQSDNGEFSIEVPAKFDFFFDKEGASPPQQGGGFYLKNMQLLNAYTDKTLVSFEAYQDNKETLDKFYESATTNRKNSKTAVSRIKGDGFTIRQVIEAGKNFYKISQFFHSKKYIYILTAGSRDGETKTLRRFLDSLVFKPGKKDSPDTKTPVLSSLKVSPVSLITKNAKPASEDKKDVISEEESANSIIILSKPRASYTDAARQNQVQGTIELRISFSENGFTPRIEVIKPLPHGLLRQAIFAALRIKFLPEEKNGNPETVEKVITYSFAIY